MKLLPHLILDVRWRSLAGAVLTPDGLTRPLELTVAGVPTRFVSSDLMGAPEQVTLGHWQAVQALELAPSKLLDKLGLSWAWQLNSTGEGARRLCHPMRLLSRPSVLEDREQLPAWEEVATVLTGVVCQPVADFLAEQKLYGHVETATLIVSSQLGRRGALVLQRILRRHGLRRLRLIPREAAAAFHLLSEGLAPEALVCDVDDDGLQLHRVTLEGELADLRLTVSGSHTIAGLGWSFFIGELSSALQEQGRLSGVPDAHLRVDRCLLSLLGAPGVSPDRSTWRLSLGDLEEVINGGLGLRWSELIRAALSEALDVLEVGSTTPWIGLGALFKLPVFTEIFAQAFESPRPRLAPRIPSLERCVEGVARALRWLGTDPGRRINLASAASLRLSAEGGKSFQLVPSTSLPARPGLLRRVRQQVRVDGDLGTSMGVPLHLLWGTDVLATRAAPICSTRLDPEAAQGSPGRELELTFNLRRAPSLQAPKGSVEVRWGENRLRAALEPPPFATSLLVPSKTSSWKGSWNAGKDSDAVMVHGAQSAAIKARAAEGVES